jgi:hypothetical protein
MRVGKNLLMLGVDRLFGGTGTPVVSQRSGVRQGIQGAKTGTGKNDMWYDFVVKTLHVGRALLGRMLRHVMSHHNGNFGVHFCLVHGDVTIGDPEGL